MSRSDRQELESQLFDDVEGLLKDYFQNNLPAQEANQSFLKASLKFLYRQLEKRLENVGSGVSCQTSSRTESNIVSFRKNGDPSQCLPPLGYQDKVRYWASKYLHARRNLSRSTSSVATSRENFPPKGQHISHTKLSSIDAVTQCDQNPKECRLYTQSQKFDKIGRSATSTSITSSEDKVLITVSGQTEGVHKFESCVSLADPKTSTSSVSDCEKKLLKNESEDTVPVGTLMNHSVWKGQNDTEKEEDVILDKYFTVITQSLEVTAQESIKIDVNDVNNDETFKCDSSTVSGSEGTRMYKDPSPSETENLEGIKDEGVFFQVSLSNGISNRDIATVGAEDEKTSSASSTKESKKLRSPSSRIHAAILTLFGAKSTEKKNGTKSGSKSSKASVGVNANNEDTIKGIRRVLSNRLPKLSVYSTGQTATSDRQNVKNNIREYHRTAFSGKSSGEDGLLKSGTSSYSDRENRLQKLKKLKVCQIPFVPACQSCGQIYTYISSGSATRDVATCTEELITGYSESKRCFACFHGLERTLPGRSESIFSKMQYQFGHRDEIEELSIIFLCALLNDLRKRSRYTSSKTNSKSRRTSRLADLKSYGATSWPLSNARQREYRTKAQQFYENCAVNSKRKEKPRLLRQPSKFSAWNGDEKSSDSDDEEYRLKHRLLPEHIAELASLMLGKRLRSTVKSSLVIKSSSGSEHIPSSKS